MTVTVCYYVTCLMHPDAVTPGRAPFEEMETYDTLSYHIISTEDKTFHMKRIYQIMDIYSPHSSEFAQTRSN